MHFFYTLHDFAEKIFGKQLFHLIRYLIAGGTAAASNVGVLFLLVYFGQLHYLIASIIAYLLAIVVSFTLQKFWTFQDKKIHDIHTQFTRYIVIVLANLCLNTLLIYILVTYFDIWYILAQILTTMTVAVTGYFGYKYFVFIEPSVT